MNQAAQTEDTAGWYSNANTTSSSEEVLSAAFSHAKLLLRSIAKPQDYESLFPSNSAPDAQSVSSHSIVDVQHYLEDAQNAYEYRTGQTGDTFKAVGPTTKIPSNTITSLSKAKAKTRLWLTGLSEKLVHYGNIFDVMVQHHPEYVALAWGTFKLLFVAITNHAETASKLSKSISQVADLLPQHSLHLILYPTPQMQYSVARLYAHILSFFLSSLKWYKDNRALHAVKSIFQPWDLKFRPEYEAIATESQQIRQLADVALKAEVRDTRLEVVQATKHWERVVRQMDEFRRDNQRLTDLFQTKFGMMESSMLSAQLTCGRRDQTKLQLPDVKKLEAWTSERNNAVLLIDTHMAVLAKTFMVDLIDLILDTRLPIIWALRYADYWDQHINAIDLIRILVLQAMQVGADRLLDGPFPVTVEQLREAVSFTDWVTILNHLLSRISHAFIALDADILAHVTAHERGEILEILETLRLNLTGRVKIVTTTSSVNRAYAEELQRSNACVKIQTRNEGDWRRSRRPRRPLVRYRR
ncbi:MAG: hypothetical protein LQ342_004288 [Letrouitia transgressa]|nr:MAG: hypothetical protein LQ342_004288 [Letrouitia transgressa]